MRQIWKRISTALLCLAMLFQTALAMQMGCCCTRERAAGQPAVERLKSQISNVSAGRCPKCRAASSSEQTEQPRLQSPCECPQKELHSEAAIRETTPKADALLALHTISSLRSLQVIPRCVSRGDQTSVVVSSPPRRVLYCSWQI